LLLEEGKKEKREESTKSSAYFMINEKKRAYALSAEEGDPSWKENWKGGEAHVQRWEIAKKCIVTFTK